MAVSRSFAVTGPNTCGWCRKRSGEPLHQAIDRSGPVLPYTTDEAAAWTLLPPGAGLGSLMPSDSLGPDGSVRLRCYLPLATGLYFAGSCPTCERVVTVGVEAAIELMGSDEATIGEVSTRLRCRPCGGRVDLAVCPDTRSVESQKRNGPLPETQGVRVRE